MEKDAHIVFYCRSGARARQALFLAKNKGFYNIQNFTGGWLSWADRSVCSKQDVEAVVNNAAPNCHLIDVRDHTEVAHGVIPTAKHLPIKEMIEAFRLPASEFKERYGFEKFDPAENLIFYCKRGWRSEAACYIAKKFGYKNGRNYKGSWNEWTSTDSSSGAAV
ncbi:hypothetical protein HK099_005871 [Clydaea vesicula]|uniref:Rhodanese domain-containing protein n=1 Tax=Clydaea vesicula TaxID=447962 RepID=A0AAD5XYA0_9FUNG|nr:hypothetical protein HK099_005871 [Clydaea vesicula]